MTLIDDLNPERFLVAGDWHAGLHQARAAIGLARNIGDDVRVIVHLGDFFYNDMRFLKGLNNELEKNDMWLLFVDGNHEDFNYLYSRPLHEDGYRHLRSRIIHLPRGFRWEWGGIKFAALGGAYSVDKRFRELDVSWWAQEWVTDDEVEHFKRGGPADVVFMHDSPAGAPNRVTDDPASQIEGIRTWGLATIAEATLHRKQLARAIDPVDPALIMHGHYHRKMDGYYTREGGRRCRVIGLDEGLAGVNKNTMLFDVVQLYFEYARSAQND